MSMPKSMPQDESPPKVVYFSDQVSGIFNSSLSSMIRSGNKPTAIVEKNLACISDSQKFIEAMFDQNFEMLSEFPKDPMDIMMDSMSEIRSSEQISNILLTVEDSVMTVTFLRNA